MQIIIKTCLLLTLSFFIAMPAYAKNERCVILDVAIHGECSSRGANWEDRSASNECSSNLSEGARCCCDKNQAAPQKISPKYLIIGAVVLVFGTITVLSFALRRNDDPV